MKAYSNQSELVKIVRAIHRDKLDTLNSNLKTKSKRIKILEYKIIKKYSRTREGIINMIMR